MACNCDKCGNGKSTGLAHIGIQVTNLEEALDFYVNVLGFEVTNKTCIGDLTLVFMNIGTCLLELVHRPEYTPRPAGNIDHIAVEVEDIDNLVCRLTEKRVKFLTNGVGDMPGLLGGVRNIFLEGPGGVRIEFFEYLNK